MKKTLLSIFILIICGTISFAQTQSEKTRPTKSLRYKIIGGNNLPPGIYIKGNKIVAKKGYEFFQKDEKTYLRKKKKPGKYDPPIFAEIMCHCINDGGCHLLTYANHIECNPSLNNPCENCETRIIITPGPTIGEPKNGRN